MSGLGAIAAGDEHALAAASAILKAGGNAVDAAVAAKLTSFTSEAALTGAGGGGFAAIFDPREGEPILYDFFGVVPGLAGRPEDIEFFTVSLSFGPATQDFHIGAGSVAVPGCLMGLHEIHRRHGRLTLEEVAAPAIRAARRGVALSAQAAAIFRILEPIALSSEGMRAIFAPRGGLSGEGDIIRNPDFADSLELLVKEGPAPFYSGGVAEGIAGFLREKGSHLSLEDLRAYQVLRREPLLARAGGAEVALNPPPTIGGLMIALGLAVLQREHAERMGPAERFHAIARALEACNRLRNIPTGGKSFHEALYDMELARGMLSAASVENLLRGLGDAPIRRPLRRDDNPLGNTTHVSVLDSDGFACGVTTSHGESCGYVAPGTGVMLNNFLGEEDINPAGFFAAPPGTRMTSMMCPTLVMQDGRAVAVLGSGGSNRIRSAILQALINRYVDDHTLEYSIRAPRLHFDGGRLSFETAGMAAERIRELREGYAQVVEFPELNMFFGGVHAVARAGDGFEAYGDPRRGGRGAVVRE